MPIELELWARTYNTYGGLPRGEVLAHLFELSGTDFGSAIGKIEITFLFPHPGPARKTLEELFANYHRYRTTQLPKVTFRRTRETVIVEVASDRIDGKDWERAAEVSIDTFRSLAGEVVQALRLLRKPVKRKDDFRLEEFLIHVEAALERLPATDGELAALTAAAAEARRKQRAALPWWQVLGIDWRDYHPSAREILNDPFFWDCGDEFAPHGNDAGADLLASYKNWLRRSPGADPLEFYQRLLRQWGTVPGTEDPLLQPEVQDAAVALAFAELKLRGECRPSATSLALDTLDAQQRRAELALDWEHRDARLAAIAKLRAVLSQAEGTLD